MQNLTRQKYNGYVSRIAELNGVSDATVSFSVSPTVEQRMEAVIKEGSEFLQSINIEPVIQQSGETLGITVTGTIAGRTDTNANDRNPVDVSNISKLNEYTCKQTNFDTALRYARVDAWRHKPEFEVLVRDAILTQQGRDRIMIGWNGTSAAVSTNRANNPLLQDVNIGWLEQIRTKAPAHVISDGALTADATKAIYVAPGTVGTEVDYQNLDALVLNAKEMIPAHKRGDTSLVVIVGHDLVDEKYFNIVNAVGDKATEVEAADRILRSEKQLGGMPAVRVPFFPANALLITTLKNLSIYYQEGTRRRFLQDEPKRDRLANYESVNEAYVVEDFDLTGLVQNIVIGKKPAGGG